MIFNETLTACRYIDDILHPVLLALLRHVRRQRQNQNLAFHHDNARPLSARLMQNFLDSLVSVLWTDQRIARSQPSRANVGSTWPAGTPKFSSEHAEVWSNSKGRMAAYSEMGCEALNRVHKTTPSYDAFAGLGGSVGCASDW